MNTEDKPINEKDSFSGKLKKYIKNLFDFSTYDTQTKFYIAIFLFLFAISVYLLYYIYFVDPTFLYRIVVEWFVNPIFLLGIIGIFLFIAIMAIQGLLVSIPSEIVLLAAGISALDITITLSEAAYANGNILCIGNEEMLFVSVLNSSPFCV